MTLRSTHVSILVRKRRIRVRMKSRRIQKNESGFEEDKVELVSHMK